MERSKYSWAQQFPGQTSKEPTRGAEMGVEDTRKQWKMTEPNRKSYSHDTREEDEGRTWKTVSEAWRIRKKNVELREPLPESSKPRQSPDWVMCINSGVLVHWRKRSELTLYCTHYFALAFTLNSFTVNC